MFNDQATVPITSVPAALDEGLVPCDQLHIDCVFSAFSSDQFSLSEKDHFFPHISADSLYAQDTFLFWFY